MFFLKLSDELNYQLGFYYLLEIKNCYRVSLKHHLTPNHFTKKMMKRINLWYYISFYSILKKAFLISQHISIYSPNTPSWIVRSVTGMVKMVTEDLHIPVIRQDRL